MAKNSSSEDLCNVCKTMKEKSKLEECRLQQEQMRRQLEERCREQIQQRIKQQICQIEMEHQKRSDDNNNVCKDANDETMLKSNLHHNLHNTSRASMEPECCTTSKDEAFGEQETFMLNRQINTELHSFYSYLSLFAYYDRDDVALKGFAQYFLRLAYEEVEHALKIIRYMNKRGGRAKFCDIRAPERQVWSGTHEALTSAMDVEKRESMHLKELHKSATANQDHHLSQYLAQDFMDMQLESMNELGCKLTQATMVGEGAGLYLYDRNLLKDERKKITQKVI